ncbi:MAG: DUF2608 domain-containing protein [Gammaproteobacteria bacterium]|nr:DUF2608 domain-containing protein [Gammaproteobacteria bacterium]
MNSNARSLTFVLLACVSLIGGCVTQPKSAPSEPLQNILAATEDLSMVADEALQLADRLGREQVLVVFDIDNTLLAMEQGLGSDQWYYWQRDLAASDPCSGMLVSDRLKVQGALFFASGMRPTQPDAAAQLQRLQAAGLPVIAVTSRGPEFRLPTFRELRRHGMAFWPSALPPQRGWPVDYVPAGGSREARYEDGVFLTAGQDKGVMIQALLAKTGTPAPAAIVIADDKQGNLDDVLAAFQGSNTAVHAWRYTREDANVAAFDGRAAAAEWDALRPALVTIERLLGPDHFDLPAQVVREGCGVAGSPD